MLALLRNFITRSFISGLLGELTKNPDTQTTALGYAAAGIIAAKVDWSALIFGHDLSQAGLALGAVVVALLGHFTNKQHPGAADQVAELVRSTVAEIAREQAATEKPKAQAARK